jgi:hypothetical protein
MKYTHGQRVKCTIDGIDITDAKISINKNGRTYICQNEIDGAEADDLLGYKYSWVLNNDFTSYALTNLRPAEKDWDTPTDLIEVTLEEIAKLKGVTVEQIRIKE